MSELWDSMVGILGDNLETAGGQTITQRKFMLVWDIVHE